jgi:cytochrome P450
MLNMVLNPEVQGKAWAEIDSVVGRDRLPTFADKDKPHYVEHIVQETLRCAVQGLFIYIYIVAN